METAIFQIKCRDCGEMFDTPYQIKMYCGECQAKRDWEDMCRYGFE